MFQMSSVLGNGCETAVSSEPETSWHLVADMYRNACLIGLVLTYAVVVSMFLLWFSYRTVFLSGRKFELLNDVKYRIMVVTS